jgi:hypothetical protein
LNESLLHETEKLTRSWAQHEPAWLRDYLVSGVEDPRLNLQSILTRHFLVRAVFNGRFEGLMPHEYRFGAVMDWLVRAASQPGDSELREAILHALRKSSDNAEGLEIPAFVLQTFAGLPAEIDGGLVPNYIEAFLARSASSSVDSSLNCFLQLWASLLGRERVPCVGSEQPHSQSQPKSALSLLEPACGSANDYRFLHFCGLARFFDYTGFDLCQKNVENARALFPAIRFEAGNVFEISADAKSFDQCIVHDLFEHLSIAGLEKAAEEICRVTRRGICIGFFQMDEIREHVMRPLDDYYWNLLSLSRMREVFANHGFKTQAIHIGSFLSHHTGCQQTHNPNAYTFILSPV